MDLSELQKNWEEFGRRDALWAILTVPGKTNRTWTLPEFFETGRHEIDGVLAWLASIGVEPGRNRVLDFGCGVGRNTQALAEHFVRVDGVDIAASMLALADEYNTHPERCFYHLNQADDLRLFGDATFTFVYSNIVLQHIAPQYTLRYLAEFLRILAPGGALVFQLPSEPARSPADQTSVPRILAPLPDGAFRAQINAHPPMTFAPGESHELAVRIRNLSRTSWPSLGDDSGFYQIRLGNHWLDEDGKKIQIDDGRANLPHQLEPGAEVGIELAIRAPSKSGCYYLALDMVQEGVAWFGDRGSVEFRFLCRTTGSKSSLRSLFSPQEARAGDAPVVPRMEMHAIPRAEVISHLELHGGKVVAVQPDHSDGPAWTSFRYCVVKQS